MKKLVFAWAVVIMISGNLSGQSIDFERMNKDLAVSENVLSTILSGNAESNFYVNLNSRNIDGDYINDYGVIFTLNGGYFRGLSFSSDKVFVYPNQLLAVPGRSRSDWSRGQNKLAPKAKSDQSDKTEKELEEEFEKYEKEAKEKFIEASKEFLADYAHLISQLKADDHIMVRLVNEHSRLLGQLYTITGDRFEKLDKEDEEEAKDEEIMIEARVGDITDLRKGQISRDQFMSKVKVSQVERSEEKQADFEMISSMFHRLYQRDLSDTYYTLSNITYRNVKGVGVVFKMKVYSSYESDNVFFMPSTGEKGLSREERNKKVQQLLPEFEEGFKQNLVNYGRSIKSLEAGELLIFEVKLTQCKDCIDFPSGLKFSIKKSVLDEFNSGKISESQAVNQVNVVREQ